MYQTVAHFIRQKLVVNAVREAPPTWATSQVQWDNDPELLEPFCMVFGMERNQLTL